MYAFFGNRVTDIQELQEVIRRLHGTESTHEKSVPVTEILSGRTVWDGMVEVFRLHDHEASRAYVWIHRGDNKKRTVASVLHTNLICSPALAVRAFMVQEFKQRAIES